MTDTPKIWRPIPGLEHKYQVSTYGLIKDIKRDCKCPPRIVEALLNDEGTPYVRLTDGPMSVIMYVKEAVWSAFKGPLKREDRIWNIDGDQLNCQLSNLELLTPQGLTHIQDDPIEQEKAISTRLREAYVRMTSEGSKAYFEENVHADPTKVWYQPVEDLRAEEETIRELQDPLPNLKTFYVEPVELDDTPRGAEVETRPDPIIYDDKGTNPNESS